MAVRHSSRWDQAGMTGGATEVTIDFNDGAAYERFMGRWSRVAGAAFLGWVAPPKHARWLEIGCGTEAFTELVLRTCAPSVIIATDPAVEQIKSAQRQLGNENVEFQIANANLLPFPDRGFDVIASALVLNFISDRKRALQEMLRVGRSGGIVAAYVWDFAAARAPNSCLALGLSHMGIEVPRVPGGLSLRSGNFGPAPAPTPTPTRTSTSRRASRSRSNSSCFFTAYRPRSG